MTPVSSVLASTSSIDMAWHPAPPASLETQRPAAACWSDLLGAWLLGKYPVCRLRDYFSSKPLKP